MMHQNQHTDDCCDPRMVLSKLTFVFVFQFVVWEGSAFGIDSRIGSEPILT